jgi:hypothetical protein
VVLGVEMVFTGEWSSRWALVDSDEEDDDRVVKRVHAVAGKGALFTSMFELPAREKGRGSMRYCR